MELSYLLGIKNDANTLKNCLAASHRVKHIYHVTVNPIKKIMTSSLLAQLEFHKVVD